MIIDKHEILLNVLLSQKNAQIIHTIWKVGGFNIDNLVNKVRNK